MMKYERLAKLKILGQLSFLQLIEESGGVLTEESAAKLLNVNKNELRIMLEKRQIIGIPVASTYEYPVFQFSSTGIKRNFSYVLNEIHTSDYVSQCRYWLLENDQVDGKKPIEALSEGERYMEKLVRTAKQFGMHGPI